MKMATIDPLRILAVDDEQDILALYEDVLAPGAGDDETSSEMDELAGKLFGSAATVLPSTTSFALSVCRQAEEAVDLVHKARKENRPFAVAFLDVRMPPGPDGVWAAEHIRKLDPHIEIVIVTGYSDVHPEDIAHQILPPHKLLYIQKPFYPQEIKRFASSLGIKWKTALKLGQSHRQLEQLNQKLQDDLVKRKKAEEALRTANAELEHRVAERTAALTAKNEHLKREIEIRKKAQKLADAANLAKSEFLANMSHELRTPLNHIIGFTELVACKKMGDLNATQEEYLKDVLSSSNHLLSLINDILDLSKVEAGRLELDLTAVEVKKLLERSLKMVMEGALKHGIELSTDIEDIPMHITADEKKLKQIIYNLLSNAVKFTPDGGKIVLAARKIVEKSNPMQPGVEISVSDTGIGLKSEDAERIFKAFEQVQSSACRKYPGTGLGLSVTKHLVELHGGKLWVESKGENHGAKFSFLIPHNQQ